MKMKNASQLKKEYETALKKLQASCKHRNVSGWLDYYDWHFNLKNRVKQCKTCWLYLERKLICPACDKEFIISEKDYKGHLFQNCPACAKKGKYYCFIHKIVYDKGCPDCIRNIVRLPV